MSKNQPQKVKITKAGIFNGIEGELVSFNKKTGKATITCGSLGTWQFNENEYQKTK